jgi:hypothetical protein
MTLRKFIVLVSFLLFLPSAALSAEVRGIKITSPHSSKRNVIGNYYALIIGINAYDEWYPLKTAVKDARALKDVLINKYSFGEGNVILKTDKDATQDNLIHDLKQFASSLQDGDNLLIYYAGHGQIDDFTGDGFWIPVDGKLKSPGTWISHSIVKSILSSQKVKAKNIALISDSCYAGTLLRSGPSVLSTTDKDYRGKILALSSRRSRQVFTSGGVEPVVDGGRDGHSLFAYYFLKALKENNDEIIDLENLFYSQVWKPVAEIGDQRPYVGRLKTPMDENGQFVLISRSAKEKDWDKLADVKYAAIEPEIIEKPAIKKKPRLAIFPMYIKGGRSGSYLLLLKNRVLTSLSEALKSYKSFDAVFSYYELDDRLKTRSISSNIIGAKIADRLWKRPSAFSPIKPDVELAIDLAKKLDVDFINMNFIQKADYFDWNTSLYLIDVYNKKIYTRNESLSKHSLHNVLPEIFEDFFSSYSLISKQTEITKITFNPQEPWTGIWDVGRSQWFGGIWAMEQSGNKVTSTKDSRQEFHGEVKGNQLKGMFRRPAAAYPFVAKISSDGQSFKGTIWDPTKPWVIEGKRKK